MKNKSAFGPSLPSHAFPLQEMVTGLEEKGWFAWEQSFSAKFYQDLFKCIEESMRAEKFEHALVGKGHRRSLSQNIRKAQTAWIQDWTSNDSLAKFHSFCSLVQTELSQEFFLSLKRWESQFACYPAGGFYKKHLDQLRENNHRQVTMILYLNNCSKGGELVIYNKHDKLKVDAKIPALRGTCVLFFSSQIYHEVLKTASPRFSLTTWFRDDLETFLG